MAERRQIEVLAQTQPIELVTQRDGHVHGGNPSDRPEKVECHRFSF